MSDESVAKLKTFCREALGMLGMSVSPEADGFIEVGVPPSQLDLFEGRESLRLAFRPEDVEDGAELIVPGSYVLERLIEAVRGRGALASTRLEPKVQPAPSPVVNLANAEARLVCSRECFHNLLLVSFRVSLVSDEDVDRLFSVVIDCATGEKSGLAPEQLLSCPGATCEADGIDGDALERAFASARTAAMSFARELADSAQQKIDARLASETQRLDQYYSDVLSEAAQKSENHDVRKAQKSRERAAKAYDDMQRMYDLAATLLRESDTVEALWRQGEARLKALYNGRRAANWSLASRYAEIAAYEREIKVVEKANQIARLAFDTYPADTRLAELDRQRDKALQALQKRREKREPKQAAPQALQELQSLTGGLEAEKAQRLAELQDKFRLRVAVNPISAALVRYPEAEYAYEAVSGTSSIPFGSRHDLITGVIHGPACQSCGGQMQVGYACGCGRLACSACHKTCGGCGKDLCSSCLTGACQVCGAALCSDCRKACAVCGKVICPTHSRTCRECGKLVCAGGENTCGKVCQICGGDFCPEHAIVCQFCHSVVCNHDTRACAECGAVGCVVDVVECACCGKPVCPQHSVSCEICGQRVCSGCLSARGCCGTCGGLFRATSSAAAIREILADAGKPEAAARGRWMIGEGRDSFVLVRPALRFCAYVVNKKTGKLTSERTLGFTDSLRARLRLREHR